MRAELAAARSQLLRHFVGLDVGTLHRKPLWPNTTPVKALARVARRDDDAACALEVLLQRPGHKTPIPVRDAAIAETLPLALAARARLLSAASRLELGGSQGVAERAFVLLAVCRDHDLRWSRRLEWWNEEQHIPFEVGPTAVLLAAMKAARKELLTALALLSPPQRTLHREELIALYRGEEDILRHMGRRPEHLDPPTGSSWTEAWRRFHDTHHALVILLEACGREEVDRDLYRRVTWAIDRDRALAIALRAGRARGPPSPPAAPERRTGRRPPGRTSGLPR